MLIFWTILFMHRTRKNEWPILQTHEGGGDAAWVASLPFISLSQGWDFSRIKNKCFALNGYVFSIPPLMSIITQLQHISWDMPVGQFITMSTSSSGHTRTTKVTCCLKTESDGTALCKCFVLEQNVIRRPLAVMHQQWGLVEWPDSILVCFKYLEPLSSMAPVSQCYLVSRSPSLF